MRLVVLKNILNIVVVSLCVHNVVKNPFIILYIMYVYLGCVDLLFWLYFSDVINGYHMQKHIFREKKSN